MMTSFNKTMLFVSSLFLSLSILPGPGWAHPTGIDPTVFPLIDDLCQDAVDASYTPGIALLIGRCPDNEPDVIVYQNAFGHRVGDESLTLDTLYDLASVTKPTFTASAVMFLIQDGLISEEDFVYHLIPGFEQQGKDDVKIKHLLTHTSGLPAYTNTSGLPPRPNPDALIGKICGLAESYATGEDYIYSCLNYITLARIVENVSGESVTRFLKRRLWDEIGMVDSTHFPNDEQRARTSPTLLSSVRPRGRVHDPLAWYYTDYDTEARACGNAGAFSTVLDEARLARLLLHDGKLYGKQLYTPEIVEKITTRQTTVASRSFGWGVSTSFYGQTADVISHSGYTGTYLFIDKTSRTYFIMFTNYVYPDDSSTNRTGTGNARSTVIRTILSHLDYYNNVPVEAVVIDNDSGAPAYVESGAWQTAGSDGYMDKSNGYRYLDAGTARAYADYQFEITEPGLYRIHSWYRSGGDRSTVTRYQIHHRTGTSSASLNQQTNGSQWNSLGLYEFNAGISTVRVDVENSSADGVVVADAVMIETIKLDSEILVDNTNPGFNATGDFGTSSASPDRYGENYHYYNPTTAGTATWNLDLPKDGVWQLFEWHNGNSTRSEHAPFTVTSADGLAAVEINQQQNVGRWVSLGQFAFRQGGGGVQLSSADDGIVIADAIKARLVSQYEMIVDDLDARYSDTEGFSLACQSLDRHDATYRTCSTGGGEQAVWQLQIPFSGQWEISEMHNNTDGTPATDAPFQVQHKDGTSLSRINQQQNSGQWISLGTFSFSKGSGQVTLTNDANGDYVVADAIRAVYLNPLSPGSVISVY